MMKKNLLTLIIIIISKFAYSLDLYWTVNEHSYENQMTLTASVYFDDAEQQNENIEVGVFCGEELRGSALPDISIVTNKYIYSVTIYGNENDVLSFMMYNHENEMLSELICNQTLTFEVNNHIGNAENPYKITFTEEAVTFIGEGDWTNNSNWKKQTLPTTDDNVIIDGNATITNGSNITVNDLTINSNKSLTIQNGGILTVNGTLSNTDVAALVIEEGAQLIHHNEGVAATFKNEIVTPSGTWGEEDNTGWQFISSPMENISTNDFVPTSGDYDLYMYDGTQENQWRNFKQMGSTLYDFSSNPLENGWTAIDADGDGNGWEYKAGRMKYMQSTSYDGENDIDVKNYLVSPQINVNNGMLLSFDAKITYKYDEEFGELPETFKVLLSNNTNDKVDDFNVVLKDYSITNNDYVNIRIDLSDYSGENVYIAFYHYLAEYGSENLIIDNVEFINENSFEKGSGYLASYQNNDEVAEFKGNLNYLAEDESFQINLKHYPDNNLAQFHLIGNPFSFNINWEANININNVYDGFATLDANSGGYVYKENGMIEAGEGFMVKTIDGANNNITFQKDINSAKRSETNSINIVASGKYGSDNVIVRHEENEDSNGFLKLQNFNDKIANIYVKSNDNNYAIFNCNEETTEIPLYFNAKEMGNYSLTFDIKGNYESLYLIDKMTGEKINLLIENEYSFIANSSDVKDRFVLSFANSQQPTANSNFAYVSGEELIINAEGTIQIIDMMGRVVYSNDVTSDNNRIDMSGFNSAAYMIRCINENEVKVQKIVIY